MKYFKFSSLLMLFLTAACCLTGVLSYATAKGALPPVLAGIPLTDQHGKAIKPASFGKGPVLLNFVFTHCSSACPIQVRELAALHRALPDDVKEKVQFLSVSVDPAHDTPEVLAQFAQRLGADVKGWRFATGKPADIAQLLNRLQVMDPAKKDPQPSDHRLTLYLFDQAGVPVIRYNGAPVDKQRLLEELTQLSRLAP